MTLSAAPASPAKASQAVLLVRILVGWVFLSEGIQKFLFPGALGVGRFSQIGLLFLLIVGARSLEARFMERRTGAHA